VNLVGEVIAKDPDVLGGTPVFRGTHVPFQAWIGGYIARPRRLSILNGAPDSPDGFCAFYVALKKFDSFWKSPRIRTV
jgi:hypothetical protein